MKKTTLVFLAVSLAMTVYSQKFQVGSGAANLSLGLGSALGGLGNQRPSVSVSADYGIWHIGGPGVVSMGGYLGNTGYKYTEMEYSAMWNFTTIGIRGSYHYNGFKAPKLDIYLGTMVGYNIANFSSENQESPLRNNYVNGIGFSGHLGGRWFFSRSLGAVAELGYGASVLNVGITYGF